MVSTAGAVSDKQPFESPEMKELFGEWIRDLKNRILAAAQEKHDPVEIAAALGMAENAFLTVVLTMAREGSIRITGIKANNK